MKPALRLGLRRVGKHNGDPREWIIRYGLSRKIMAAFEMNCHPKHYDTGIQEPTYTMDYITGETTWHGPPSPLLNTGDWLLKSVSIPEQSFKFNARIYGIESETS